MLYVGVDVVWCMVVLFIPDVMYLLHACLLVATLGVVGFRYFLRCCVDAMRMRCMMRCLVDRNRSIPIISFATFPSVSIEVSKSTLCPQYKDFFHFVRTLMLEAFKILI